MKTTFAKQVLPIIAAAVGALLSQQSQAGFVFGYGAAFNNQNFTGILGNNFSVNANSSVTVNELGVFDQDTPSSISIAIYGHSGSDPGSGWTQVAGTSQTINGTDPVDGATRTRYISIAPVTLGPGLYSVVTATSSDYNSGNPYVGPSVVTFNDLGGALTQGAYDIWGYGNLGTTLSGMYTTGPNTPWPWPLPVFGAGTFSVVPEPTTIISGVLMLLPFGASTLRILRRNRAA
jgi:hypothetical protein